MTGEDWAIALQLYHSQIPACLAEVRKVILVRPEKRRSDCGPRPYFKQTWLTRPSKHGEVRLVPRKVRS